MFAKRLYADRWDNLVDKGQELPDPTPEQVRQAILDLDGRARTLVTVVGTDENQHLSVGGGEDNAYVVYATTDDQRFKMLRSRSNASSASRSVVAGGQAGDYPDKWVVELDQALAAVTAFASDGGLDPAQVWDDQ